MPGHHAWWCTPTPHPPTCTRRCAPRSSTTPWPPRGWPRPSTWWTPATSAPSTSSGGTVNLIGAGRDRAHEGRSHEGLCPSGHAGDLGPGLKGLGPGGSVLGGRAVIAAEMEEIVDPVMGGEEALGLARRLEPLHLPLASPGRLVRILCSVIQALVPPVLDRGHHLAFGRAVAGQLVRDHDTRGPALLFQQLAEQALGGSFVPPALDQGVEHDPILVDRPPEPVLRSPDHQAHFIEVPLVARAWQPTPDLVGEALAELAPPLPHGLMAHGDAAGGQHLFD